MSVILGGGVGTIGSAEVGKIRNPFVFIFNMFTIIAIFERSNERGLE